MGMLQVGVIWGLCEKVRSLLPRRMVRGGWVMHGSGSGGRKEVECGLEEGGFGRNSRIDSPEVMAKVLEPM